MEPGLNTGEMFWGLYFFICLALLAWVVMFYLRRDQGSHIHHNNDAELAESSPEPPGGSLRDWLDQRANILISRRHKHHKHHHQHRHTHR